MYLLSEAMPPNAVRLEYLLANGNELATLDVFGTEDYVYVDRSFEAGAVRVLANDQLCDGSIEIAAGLEVDAFITFDGARCAILVAGAHPPGIGDHFSARTGFVVMADHGSEIVVRSLDNAAALPIRGTPDDAGDVGFELEAGRYEIAVVLGGVVLKTEQMDLERNREWVVNLRVLDPNVPVDCGEVARPDCEAAVAAAFAWGLFYDPDVVVTAVAVAPTTIMSCGHAIDPEWDVTFEFQEDGSIPYTSTVGFLDSGRLTACSH